MGHWKSSPVEWKNSVLWRKSPGTGRLLAGLRGRLLRPNAGRLVDNSESADVELMAYTFCKLACRCHVIQVRVSGGLGQCRVDLLSVPVNQAGHLMPHAQSAGSLCYRRAPSIPNGYSHGLPERFTGALTIEHRLPSCAVQAFVTLTSPGLSIAPSGISPCSR